MRKNKNKIEILILVGITVGLILSSVNVKKQTQNESTRTEYWEYNSKDSRTTKETLQLSNDSPNWTLNGNEVCTSNFSQVGQQICSDNTGGSIIVWQDSRNGNYDIYAQRIASNGKIQWTLNGEEICTNVHDQIKPQICTDEDGGVIIVWQDGRGQNGQTYDIYAQRIASNGSIQWTLDGEGICTRSDYQKDPQICIDGHGGAIITWEDFTDDRIYAQKIASNGSIPYEKPKASSTRPPRIPPPPPAEFRATA